MTAPHTPVLLDEVLSALAIVPGETHIDGTYGAGGYSRAMLGAGAEVAAFDRDPDAIAAAEKHDRLTLIEDVFSSRRARFFIPVRWPARHADGAGGAERCRLRQHRR
jgi:16S rRNA C1402 N4-methylase RsmH